MRIRVLTNVILATTFISTVVVQTDFTNAAPGDSLRFEDDTIVIHSGGIDRLLVDDRDQALKRALLMLGERLGELPEEVGDPGMPPGDIIEMIYSMFLRPMTLRAGLLEDVDPNEHPPFYAQLLVGAHDAAQAKANADQIIDLLRQAMGEGAPIDQLPTDPNMNVIDIAGTPAYIGSGEIGGHPVFVAGFQKLDMEPTRISGLGLPAGVRPAFAVRYDLGAVTPFIEAMLENAGPEAGMIRAQMEAMGVLSDNPMKMTLALGYGDDRAHGAMRMENYLNNPMYGAIMSRKPLTRDELALIPADATSAQMGRLKFQGLGTMIQNLFGQMAAGNPDMPDIFEMIEEQTGIHPQRDIFAHLGEMAGYYTSDSTGGGGILSTVGIIEVANEDALRETMNKMTAMINDMAADQANGYVQFRTRTVGRREMTTLTFPGLPVPLEVSFGLHGGYLFVGATPQALIAAIDQADHGERSILLNPHFREMNGTHLDEAISVMFIDTPRLIGTGYSLMALGASALSNAVKSRENPERDPGLVLPSYAELTRGAKAMVSVAWFEENDMVGEVQMDRCMLVNMTGIAGSMGGIVGGMAILGIGAAVAMPAVAQARGQARAAQAGAQLRQFGMALAMYDAEHGSAPESIDQLIEGNYITQPLLSSPLGPVWDDNGDYWFDLRGQATNGEWDRILGYDRAMLLTNPTVSVLFQDGHVEMLGTDDFLVRIEDEKYEGVDFKLPW